MNGKAVLTNPLRQLKWEHMDEFFSFQFEYISTLEKLLDKIEY